MPKLYYRLLKKKLKLKYERKSQNFRKSSTINYKTGITGKMYQQRSIFAG